MKITQEYFYSIVNRFQGLNTLQNKHKFKSQDISALSLGRVGEMKNASGSQNDHTELKDVEKKPSLF